MQWRASQEFAPMNYMMPPGPNPYNPYWNGMQPGMDPFMGPYGGGMPYMPGYGLGPMDVPFGGGMFPQDPFGASGGLMMPPFIPPQRYCLWFSIILLFSNYPLLQCYVNYYVIALFNLVT